MNFVGALAQLAERFAGSEEVTGSRPVSSTKNLRDPLAQSVEQLTFNQWVVGSIPTRVTSSI